MAAHWTLLGASLACNRSVSQVVEGIPADRGNLVDEEDEVGLLVGYRCPHCTAALYLSEEMEARGQRPICLNACDLPVWQYRIMQQGLRDAMAHVQGEGRQDVEARATAAAARPDADSGTETETETETEEEAR